MPFDTRTIECNSGVFVKKLIVFILVVGALVMGKDRILGHVSSKAARDGAERRVTAMLDGWQKGGTGTGGDAQVAVCQYYAGVIYISDQKLLEAASDGFDRFRRDKKLYRSIKSYEVVGSEAHANDQSTSIVRITIDGEPYELEVRDKQPIRWADRSS